MANKLMQVPTEETQNNPFCRFQLMVTQLNEPTIQNLIKVLKVVKPTNNKTVGDILREGWGIGLFISLVPKILYKWFQFNNFVDF